MRNASRIDPDASATKAPERVRPRWEWRLFETAPGEFIDTLAPFAGYGAPSLEIYILSARSPDNTKIRGGHLEIKHLEGVGTNGLELWRPVLKEVFPLSADALAPLWDVWRVPAAASQRSVYSVDDFLLEIVGPRHDVLRAVSVTKARSRLTQFDCQAERAELVVAGEHWETFALEDEDPARIVAVQQALAVDPARGSNYPAWLKQVVGRGQSSPFTR